MTVHIHGPEVGRGLACNESLLPDDSLRGACMADVEDPIERDRRGELARIIEEDLDFWFDEDHIVRGTD